MRKPRETEREPVVALNDGHVVLGSIFDTVWDLFEHGYGLDLDDEGNLTIEPAPPNPAVLEVLQTCTNDVEAIVGDLTAKLFAKMMD